MSKINTKRIHKGRRTFMRGASRKYHKRDNRKYREK